MQRRMDMESLDDPCDICGDLGYAELMVTCSSCPARQHIYCAAQVFHEVPEDWYCEDCQSTDHANLTISHLQEESIAMVPSPSSREAPNTTSPSIIKRQVYPKGQRAAKPRKVMYLPTEEVIKLSARERMTSTCSHMCPKPAASSRQRNPLKSKVFASKSPVREKGNQHLISSGCQHPLKSRSLNIGSSINQQREFSAAKELKDGMNSISGKKDLVQQPEKHVGEEQSMDIDGLSFEEEESIRAKEESMNSLSPISPSRSSQRIDKSGNEALLLHLTDGMNSISGKKDLVQQPEKHVGEEQSMDIDGLSFEREESIRAKEESTESLSPISPSRSSQPIDKSGGNNDAVAEYGYTFEETRFLHYILPKLKVCWPYLPSLSATWSGRLKFLGDAIPDDSSYLFRAHPPCSVHRKAYVLSLHMPLEIRMEPIPLTHILTDIFQNEGPGIGDIGLYFYPANTVDRYIAKYSALVQLMVSQEYAMRGVINGAELLLFTSKELHVDSHLFIVGSQSEYFLWGIFRSAKSTLDCESLHEELNVRPPLSVEDHSNNGHPNSNKSGAIVSITGIDDLSRNFFKGNGTSHEEGTVDEIALPGTDFGESFQEHAQGVVMDPVAANCASSPLVKITCCPTFNVKREDTCSERVYSSSGVETAKQSIQQVKVEVQEIALDKHNVVERSPKLPPAVEKPNKKVGLPEIGCSYRNWVKLNTSGFSRGNTGSAGAGGTVHTSSGKWVLGYSLNLGKWSSLAADLWAIFQGLELVWDRGYRQVLVVSDSCTALECLKMAPQTSDPNSDLIQSCRDLMSRDWDCNVCHISREKNAAAAWLAYHSELYPLGRTELDDPPQELAHILKNQDNGISPPS